MIARESRGHFFPLTITISSSGLTLARGPFLTFPPSRQTELEKGEVVEVVQAAALELIAHGVSVFPTKGKAPIGPWKHLQERRLEPVEVVGAYKQFPNAGVAVVCGEVSGNLLMIETEGRASQVAASLPDLAASEGLGDLWNRVSNGWVERSPSGGTHWFVRCEEVGRNEKLAARPSTQEELHSWKEAERVKAGALAEPMRGKRLAVIESTTPDKVPQVLAETRANGGYVIAAPTPGSHHDTGRPWERMAGGPGTVPTLTGAELGDLLDMFRTFDAMPKREPQAPLTASPGGPVSAPNRAPSRVSDRGPGERLPGDLFEERVTWGEILEPHGWTVDHVEGATTYWTRPGKDTGVSASTGHAGDRNRLYVFSSSVPELEPERPYTMFHVYAALNHGGDHKAASEELRRQGYVDPNRVINDLPGATTRPVSAPGTLAASGSGEAAVTPTGDATGPQEVDLEQLAADLIVSSAGKSLDGFLERNRKRALRPPISTGLATVDAALGGGLLPGLTVLGALSSLGKTTFALQIADHVAASEKQRGVIVFSLEQGADELTAKSLSRLTRTQGGPSGGINALKARGLGDMLTPSEEAALDRAVATYRKQARNLWIYEGVGNLGTRDIRRTVEAHMSAFPHWAPPLIVVDYLQVIAPDSDRLSDKQAVDRAVTSLKQLSRDTDCPIVAVSSLNRASYSGPVTMAAFKESGAIEYGSDVLLGIQPQGLQDGEGAAALAANNRKVKEHRGALERDVEVVVLKNRNGKVGEAARLVFEPVFSLFRSPTGGEIGRAGTRPRIL